MQFLLGAVASTFVFEQLFFIILRHIIYDMGAKSSAQRERFLPDFANCVRGCSQFSPNCCAFAVECD